MVVFRGRSTGTLGVVVPSDMVGELATLRGRFVRAPTEYTLAMAWAFLGLFTPIIASILAPSRLAPVYAEDWVPPVAVEALFLLSAAVWLNAVATEYEFDGATVTCRRPWGSVVWVESLVGLRSAAVKYGFPIPLDWLVLKWDGRSHRVYLNRALNLALARQLHNT
jgi:hypothetical protein